MYPNSMQKNFDEDSVSWSHCEERNSLPACQEVAPQANPARPLGPRPSAWPFGKNAITIRGKFKFGCGVPRYGKI